jgi:hypothetical protein
MRNLAKIHARTRENPFGLELLPWLLGGAAVAATGAATYFYGQAQTAKTQATAANAGSAGNTAAAVASATASYQAQIAALKAQIGTLISNQAANQAQAQAAAAAAAYGAAQTAAATVQLVAGQMFELFVPAGTAAVTPQAVLNVLTARSLTVTNQSSGTDGSFTVDFNNTGVTLAFDLRSVQQPGGAMPSIIGKGAIPTFTPGQSAIRS